MAVEPTEVLNGLKVYILINDEDPPKIETTCLWDGVTPYEPPFPTWKIELQTDPINQNTGAVYIDGQWRNTPSE